MCVCVFEQVFFSFLGEEKNGYISLPIYLSNG